MLKRTQSCNGHWVVWERPLLLMEFSGMSIADLVDGVADWVFACVCWPFQCFAGVLRCVFGSGRAKRAMIGGLAGDVQRFGMWHLWC